MRSRSSMISRLASRSGAAVSIDRRATWPSLRNSATSNRRPPSARSASRNPARTASASIAANAASLCVNGEAKRASTLTGAGSVRGAIGASTSPINRASDATIASPKRAASAGRCWCATAPMVFSPARRSARCTASAAASTVTGRSSTSASACSASANAASGVPATASPAVNPSRSSRRCRSSTSPASPP